VGFGQGGTRTRGRENGCHGVRQGREMGAMTEDEMELVHIKWAPSGRGQQVWTAAKFAGRLLTGRRAACSCRYVKWP